MVRLLLVIAVEGDWAALEKVQRASRTGLGRSGSLRSGLFSLEWKRLRGEMGDVYNIVRGIDRVDAGHSSPQLTLNKIKGQSVKCCQHASCIEAGDTTCADIFNHNQKSFFSVLEYLMTIQLNS